MTRKHETELLSWWEAKHPGREEPKPQHLDSVKQHQPRRPLRTVKRDPRKENK